MWRCNHLHALILFAFALGVLLGRLVESGFFCTLLIAGALCLGFTSMGKGR